MDFFLKSNNPTPEGGEKEFKNPPKVHDKSFIIPKKSSKYGPNNPKKMFKIIQNKTIPKILPKI